MTASAADDDDTADGSEDDVGWFTRELRGVVCEIRAALVDPKAILIPYPDRRRDAYVLGGLSHCCLALEELDDLRLMGHDFLGYLVGRNCLETWLTAAWLFLKGEEAEEMLMGDYARHLRAQHNRILDDFDKARQKRRKVRESRKRLARNNENIRRANELHGTSMPLRDLPVLPPVPAAPDVDLLERHVRQMRNVVSASVSFEMMADQLGPLAERAGIGGGNWTSLYNVVYRSLSTWGAHPSIWMFDQYLDHGDTKMLHVLPAVEPEGRAHMVALSALHLVAMLAAEVFTRLGIDDAHMREAVATCQSLEAYLRTQHEAGSAGGL